MGEPSDFSGSLDLGDGGNGAEIVLEWVPEQIRNFGDVCLAESSEPGSQDLLDLLQGMAVSRQDVVEDPSDLKHGYNHPYLCIPQGHQLTVWDSDIFL